MGSKPSITSAAETSSPTAIATRTPHFVFLDLKLPVHDGFEVLAWIRQERQSNLPVAILSSSPEEKDMRRARELGANCYLLKPPDASMLRRCWKEFDLSGAR